MSKKHRELLDKAKEAINRLFEDKSVSPRKTRESLVDLRDDIDAYIDSLPRERDE